MTTRPATGPGPSTETARYVADMLAARGYPSVAETVRDVADEIDDDHVHQRPDGLWTTEPIPAGLVGHITGAQPAEPKPDHRTPGQVAYEAWTEEVGTLARWSDSANQDRWEAIADAVIAYHEEQGAKPPNPHVVTYTATMDADSVARAVAGALGDLLALDEEFGRDVLRRLTKTATRADQPAPASPKLKVTFGDLDQALAAIKKGARRGAVEMPADPPTVQLRPVVGEFYRLRTGVDRLGVPTDAQRVRVLHITHDGLSAMVEWPDLPAGPEHQSTMIPTSHLVVTP